jgi:hypothetical protein
VGTDTAWATDRGEPIVRAMLAHLRTANVLVPAAAVLERIGLAARVRARKRAFQVLAEGLTEAERDALDALLVVDPELRRSRFAWLREHSVSPAPSNFLELLNRLEYVRGLKIDPERAGRIHAARLGRLVEHTDAVGLQALGLQQVGDQLGLVLEAAVEFRAVEARQQRREADWSTTRRANPRDFAVQSTRRVPRARWTASACRIPG